MSTYIKHTFYYFLSKGLPGVLTFLAILYYSDNLRPDQYGVYSLIIAVIGVLNIVFLDWFRFGVARFMPEYISNNTSGYFLTFVKNKVKVAISLVIFVTLLVYFLFDFIPDLGIERWMILVIGGLLILQYIFILFTRIIITEMKPQIFMWANFIKTILTVSISVLLVFTGFGYKSLLIGLSLGLAISNLYLLLKIKFPKSKFSFKTDRELLKKMASYSLPLAASAGFSYILSFSNRFIINHFRGVSETGLFSLGFDFSQQTIGVFISIAATSAFPIAMKLYTDNGNDSQLKKHMNNTLWMLFVITIPIVIVFAATSRDIITLFLGDDFSKLNYLVIPIISINTFIMGIKGFYFDLYFYIIKETRYQLLILIGIAIINVALNIYFIPTYGYVAAIWVSLFTSILAVIVTYIVTNRLLTIKINLLPLIKTVLAALAMFFVIKLYGDTNEYIHFILKVVIGILVYLLLSALLNKNLVMTLIKKQQQ